MTKHLNRESEYPIDALFLSRISWRAFSEERLTEEELMSLFEAAKWAPSSYNGQPWRIVYGRRGEKEWDILYNVLIDFNKEWCKKADTLLLFVSRNQFEHNEKPAVTSRFDTGAAWMSLALAAHLKGLVAHGMQGFDYEKIRKDLKIPSHYTVEAMAAVGKLGKKEDLPEEIRKKEEPSERKKVKEIVAKGTFNFK